MNLRQIVRRYPVARSVLHGPIVIRRAWRSYRSAPQREMIDRISRLVLADVRLRVDEFDGEFIVGPRSHLLHRVLSEGAYEPELVALFLRNLDSDRDVIDVGANIGFFTVLAAKRLGAGKVLAAEPTAAGYQRLTANIAANGVVDKVILFNGLVAERDDVRTINVVDGREEYSSLGAVVHPSVAGERCSCERVQAMSMDSLVAKHALRPGLIKIDVEGAEAIVLGGAAETLERHRPVVIAELSRPLLETNGSSPEAVIGLLEGHGYDVRDPHDPQAKPGRAEFGEIIAFPRREGSA